MVEIRRGRLEDVSDIALLYEEIHDAEESGKAKIGWIRGVYPTENTARKALERDDLFVMLDGGKLVGAAVINKIQVDVYKNANWTVAADEKDVCVLHTLCILPSASGGGLGRFFVLYYEDYAKRNGCKALRIDTNEKNERARKFYAKMGYKEVDILPCDFNGIKDARLVLLEKAI